MTPSDRKVAVHLALPETVEALWATTFKAKLRSQIRRPTKEGMTARDGSDQLDAFYSVFSRNMRDLGTPVLPRAFFTRLQTVFGGSVSFTTVYTANGLAAAAACCLTWKDEIEVTWASSLRELNHLAPNMLLYANLMEQAIAARLPYVQLRPVHAGEPDASVQVAMGRARPSPCVAVVVAWRRGEHAIPRSPGLSSRHRCLATASVAVGQSSRSTPFAAPSVILESRMDVTVAICTWNRAKLLDATLAQMCKLRIPSGITWELLVVDNNCTDDTPAVIERYADLLPIRRLVEKGQGISYARNCVHRNAAAELLLWTDDDVLVDTEWIVAYVRAAERWPNAGYFGGLIEPWFEHDPPSWFRANAEALAPAMALRDFGPVERELAADEPPFGANMAFRRAAFSSGDYDTRLGTHGNDRILGDETTYCRGLAANGFQAVWVPSAKVRHYVVAHRLTLRFVREYWIGLGRTQVRMESAAPPGATPRWIYRALVTSHARYLWRRATRHPGWLGSLMEVSRVRGVLMEHRNGQKPAEV